MGVEFALIATVLVVGFYLSWNIGANDVSNAMGTSVGSGALTLKRAVIIAAILEFAGAFFLGSNVSETLQSGIVDPSYFANRSSTLLLGMISALLATAIWLQVASYFGWPVSTTHAIVGAILGFGWLIGGREALKIEAIGSIALSWILSPALSAFASFMMFSFIQRAILYSFNPIKAAKRIFPFIVFIVSVTFCTSGFLHTIRNLEWHIFKTFSILLILLFSLFVAILSKLIIRKRIIPSFSKPFSSLKLNYQLYSLNKAMKHLLRLKLAAPQEVRGRVSASLHELQETKAFLQNNQNPHTEFSPYNVVEQLFSYLQVVSACFVAFGHGANDVANAIGPVAAVLKIIQQPGSIGEAALVPSWLLFLGGVGIVIGLATWGWRVIETIGKKITQLTPTRGFCAEFGAATTILIASQLGLPISTTHCIVGAVLGIGLAKGISSLNLRTLKEIALSWVITLPASAAMCLFIFALLKTLTNLFIQL